MPVALSVGVVVLVLLAACGGQTQSELPLQTVAPEAAGSGFAPDFRITAYRGADVLGGEETTLSKFLFRGKPVVLNFWAGACPPCRAEMPDFEQVHQQYKDRVILFGLDVGPFVGLGSREDGKKLIEELGITYPTGTTFDAEIVSEYGVLGMPTTIFIKPNGKIVKKWTGLLNKSKMTELVEELLAASGKP
jgi:thiol-disulfide isomerase/thioredoxin